MSRDLLCTEADFYGIAPLISLLDSQITDSCGGSQFHSLIKPPKNTNEVLFATSKQHSIHNMFKTLDRVAHLISLANQLVVLYEDASIYGYQYSTDNGWKQNFHCDEFALLSKENSEEISSVNVITNIFCLLNFQIGYHRKTYDC